ncbi:cupin domain-containing protein [Streptomyces sp. TRM72054]|uniref:cupin domain-containing protein n=1 Tax=Streptomyces sp. TRM72054 TaxID=2870562 RepID=UPI0027E15FDE|nr:cupin domain-containing protein [Streptomyces sp. TRM72054]
MTGSFWFLGGTVDVKLPGHAAQGRAAQLEFHDPEQQSPPLHVHTHEDEIWAVLDGEITFFVGDEQYDLSAGDVAFGPRGVPHSYVVRSPTSRMLVTFAPPASRNGSPATAPRSPPPANSPRPLTWTPRSTARASTA